MTATQERAPGWRPSRRAPAALRHSWLGLRRSRAGVWVAHRRIGGADVTLASYPRSGNSWLRFVLAELLARGASWRLMEETIPYVRGLRGSGPRLASAGGRLWKSHEPYRDEYRRAIYLLRDPRAVLVSRWHFHCWLYGSLPFERYVETDADSRFGSWSDHVEGWIGAARRSHTEIELLGFEAALAEPAPALRRCCRLIGIERDDDTLVTAAERASKERMHAAERSAYPERFAAVPGGSGHARIGGRSWQEVLTRRHLDRLAPEVELWESLTSA